MIFSLTTCIQYQMTFPCPNQPKTVITDDFLLSPPMNDLPEAASLSGTCMFIIIVIYNLFMNHLYSVSDDLPLSQPMNDLPEAASLSSMCLLY